MIECRLCYKGAACYDEVLSVEVWLARLERVQLEFGYRVLNGAGKLVLRASTDHVCATIKSKPKRLPAELAAALQPYLRSEEMED